VKTYKSNDRKKVAFIIGWGFCGWGGGWVGRREIREECRYGNINLVAYEIIEGGFQRDFSKRGKAERSSKGQETSSPFAVPK